MMGAVLGIDVGGSLTKIVGFSDGGNMNEQTLITPTTVRAADPLTSLYGAFGKYTDENGLTLSDVECVMMTGVGAAYMQKKIYSLTCHHCAEFDAVGIGGLYLSSLDRAIVASLGTGTAIVYSEKGKKPLYLGGTGVGGGTLTGLARNLIGTDKIDEIEELSKTGDLRNIDLLVGDLTCKDITGMTTQLTASNFGNISGLATRGDIALGLYNMVYETVAMMSIFAARNHGTKDIVLTGNLTTSYPAKKIFSSLGEYFDVNFIIPEYSQYSTVIGAALSYRR